MRIPTGRAATLLLAIASVSILSSGCHTTATASAESRAALDGFLDFYFHGYRTGLPDATERAAFAEEEWQDTVQLIRAGDAWLVDDVMRGGHWDFGAKGSVKSQLLAVAALCTTP